MPVKKKQSSLGIVAFILSLLGPLAIVGLILGIVDTVKDKSKKDNHGLSIAAIIISAIACLFWLMIFVAALLPDTYNDNIETTTRRIEITTEAEKTTEKPTETTTEKAIKELSVDEYGDYVSGIVKEFAEENNLAIVKTETGIPYLNFYLTPYKVVDGKNVPDYVDEDKAKELYEKAKNLILENFTDCYSTKYRYSIVGIFIGNCEKDFSFTVPLMYFANLQFDVEDYQNGKEDYWIIDYYYDTFWENKP